MIIDRNVIQQAQESLGSQFVADWIAELLEADHYDEKRHVCSCFSPSHRDSTPSCSWDPKRWRYYCFGCGESWDIISALIQSKHMTFVDACKELCSVAKVPLDYTEQGIRRVDYKYPQPAVNDNKNKVYEYWRRRGISKETIDYLDIQEDKQGNTLFNYYDTNDVLSMVKIRKSCKVAKGETKTWCLSGADTSPLLYNMNRINYNEPLIICSGEGDCATAIECGFYNVVSEPLGDQNLQWVSENFDWLQQFSEIILIHDNDSAGMKFARDASIRLGEYRTKIADIPKFTEEDFEGKRYAIDDLNELLYYEGKQAVSDVIMAAKRMEIETLVDYSDVDDANMSEVDGFITGFKDVDILLDKFYCGTTTILTGSPGCVDGETEFFNGKVWKPIKDWDHDNVMIYNPNGSCTITKPRNYYKMVCDEMVEIWNNHNIHQKVSLDHDLVYFTEKGNLVKQNVMKAIRSHKKLHIPNPHGDEAEEYQWQMVKPSDGYKYCFRVYSGMLVLRYQGVINVTGNSGKSSLISTLVCQALDQGFPTFVYSGELSNNSLKNWIQSVHAGQIGLNQYSQAGGGSYYKIRSEVAKAINETYKGQLFFYKDSVEQNTERLFSTMEAAVRLHGVKFIVMDNMSSVSIDGEKEDGTDHWMKQSEFIRDIINFAKKWNVVCLVVLHPKKMQFLQHMSLYDLSGVVSAANLAHRVIALYRVPDKEKEGLHPVPYDVTLDILKDRYGNGANKSIGLYYDCPSKRFFQTKEDLAHSYHWDIRELSVDERLPYGCKQLTQYHEVFGAPIS